MRRGLFGCILLLWTGTAAAQPYIGGFVEGIQAFRIQPNSALDASRSFSDWPYPRSEVRVQLQLSGGGDRDEYFVRLDFVSDRLDESVGRLDLREAYLKLYLADWTDLKIGRQVATWGTGDLLFVNDLFARDWVAFFTGLDVQYLKRPQDLLRMAFYLGAPTLEIALSPVYTMDNLPTGERLSFYDPLTDMLTGPSGAPPIVEPPNSFGNGEVYGRLYGMAGDWEWALYGYRGFYPQPQGVEIVDSTAVLYPPRLTSGGASLRGTFSGFLLNGEGAMYYSNEDSDGTDPLIVNSSVRMLAGAERSLGHDWTASAQWFGDWMLDYDDYLTGFDLREPQFEELRHSLTLRLTKFLINQTFRWTMFTYWGVTDEDVFVRTFADYNVTDAVKLTLGLNWLDGNMPQTTMGQFQNNSNIYGRIRYSF